jgi:hypothetical protein
VFRTAVSGSDWNNQSGASVFRAVPLAPKCPYTFAPDGSYGDRPFAGPNFAKVGVEGSNPFARSKFP